MLAASCGGKKQPTPAPRDTGPPRDLLLVTLDTFRADRAGCYGNPDGLTPSIDRALRSALVADDAFAPAPLTGVSHSTIFTGLQPYHHGVRDNAFFPLPDSVTTLAEHLSKHGFRTGGFIAAFPLKKRFGFGQGFATFDEDLGPDPSVESYYAERPAHQVVDRALAWVGGLTSADRMFLWTHFYDAHFPYEPPAVWRRMPVASNYEREICEVDLQLGRLLRGLAEAGRRPLVVLISDHGEGLGDHGELQHGIILHQETVRGLLGFAAPDGSDLGKQLRGVHTGVTRYTQIAPTALEALAVEPMSNLDGASLLSAKSEDGAYAETYYSMLHYRWSPLFSWRDERWAYLEGPHPQLFDRLADPGERQNVIGQHPDVAKDLAGKIADVEEAPNVAATKELDTEASEKLASLGYVASQGGTFDAKKDPYELLDAVRDLDEGISLLLEGQPRDAFPKLQAAYGADPDNPTAVFQLANCWRTLGDAAMAKTYYRRAVEIDPRNPPAWANLAILRFQGGEQSEAIQTLEEGLRSNPEAFPLLLSAGVLSRSVGRAEDARRYLTHAIQVAPTRPEALEELAKLEDQAGNAAEAAKLRERAAALAPHPNR